MRRVACAAVATLLLVACGRNSAPAAAGAGGGEEPLQHAPAGDPATLPKIEATPGGIAALIRDRYGAAIARNLNVGVEEQAGGKRVSVFGEVPNEEIRQALIKELEVRLTDMKSEDFTIETAGPIPQVFSFPADYRSDQLVAFSPDLSTTVMENGVVYETATGRRINHMALEQPRVLSMAFSPDGKTLAVGYDHGGLYLYGMPLGRPSKILSPIDAAHSAGTAAVQFTADGKQLYAVNSEIGELVLWNPATGASRTIGSQYPRNTMGHGLDGYMLAVAPAGNYAAVLGRGEYKVSLWDTGARTRKVLDAPNVNGEGFAFSHDGKFFAAARGVDEPRGVVLFEVPSGKATMLSRASDDLIRGVAFSADDRTLAVDYVSQGVVLWDVAARKEWQTIDKEKVGQGESLAFSPDGTVLATSCESLRPPQIRLWNVSKRPGGKAEGVRMPPLLDVPDVVRDDRYVTDLERSIRGRFPPREIDALQVELQADRSILLTGRVADDDVRRIAQEAVERFPIPEELGIREPIKVINKLESAGRRR
jgi:WD40 repeat protein